MCDRILKTGLLTLLVSALCLFNSEWAIAQTSPYVRENIYTFIQTPAKLQALKNGIAAMKAKPASDPTSWIYQANIHGTYTSPASPLWNTCEHGSFFFLSWHRMYLYYFERILRKASGDPNFALPYWNYTDFVSQRAMPEPFRLPANSTNPLYNINRADIYNQGAALPDTVVSYKTAFNTINFTSTISSIGFGGALNLGSVNRGQIERQPHDAVHVEIGGDMSQVKRAALDPIFWLHHANIDRLWESWLKLGGGRTNPSDSTFLNTSFTFFNENGQQVSLTGSQILNTVTQLNYKYDQLSPVINAALLSQPNLEIQLKEVGETPITEVVTLAAPQSVLRANSIPAPTPTIVNIEGVQYDPKNIVPYDIYLNLPPGVKPSPDSPYYAGKLALFAYPQGATVSIDVTDAVTKLKTANLLKNEKLAVTLVPPEKEKFITTKQIVKRLQALRARTSAPNTELATQDVSLPTPKIRFRKLSVTTGILVE
jgi:tyrosinase